MNHNRDSGDDLRSNIADALAKAAQALRQPHPQRQPDVRPSEVKEPVPESDLRAGDRRWVSTKPPKCWPLGARRSGS